MTATFLSKNGWDIFIYINGNLLDRSIIGDSILISRKENSAASLKFTIIPPWGTENAEQYIGKPIFVNIMKLVGGAPILYRAFTGWVDTPIIDLIERKILYECSDRRRQQIMQLPYVNISNIGYYSKYVFGDAQDQEDELNKRIQTIPYSFDFDQWGNPTLTAWYNPSQTNWTYTNSDVYYEPYPKVEYRSRQSKVNTVLINIRYTYKRLIQQVASVTWSGWADFITWHNQGTPTFPTKTMVQSAANSSSWFPIRPINFVNLWPAGAYSGVLWQPNEVINNYVPLTTATIVPYYATPSSAPQTTWPDGKEHAMNQTVLDSSGNPIMVLQSSTIIDKSSNLCRGASWFAAKHIVQSITEYYPLQINSPAGISAYGKVLKQENITINDSYDSSGWLGQKSINTINSPLGTAINLFTNTIGYVKGSMSITCVAGGTGSLYYGNLITFSNDPSGMTYMVTNTIPNVSGGCIIQIASPGLSGALPATSGAVTVVPNLGAGTGYYNYKTKQADLNNAIYTSFNRANTTLQGSYRDVVIKFKRFITPEIDLSHYVHLSTTRINSHGKVSSIEHNINIQTGEAFSNIELLLSRPPAVDTATNLALSIPPYEDISYILNNTINVVLGTHVGQNPDTSVNAAAINWNGYIGNANTNPSYLTPNRTQYQEQFIVDYPALPPDLTNSRIIAAQIPGTATGVLTNTAGYLAGVSNITLQAHGSGNINAGDTFTIIGDSTGTVYQALDDITNVASGGVLNFTPSLVQSLGTSAYSLSFFSNPNQATCSIPQDSLTVTFV